MMKLIIIPSILIISYLVCEVFKHFIKKKYIPIVAMITGGLLGFVNFLIIPDSDIMTSIAIGIVSGLSATGSNQILKQLQKEKGK